MIGKSIAQPLFHEALWKDVSSRLRACRVRQKALREGARALARVVCALERRMARGTVLDNGVALGVHVAAGGLARREDDSRSGGDGAHEGGDGEGAHGEGGEELPGQVGRGRVSRCRGTGGNGEGLTSLKV